MNYGDLGKHKNKSVVIMVMVCHKTKIYASDCESEPELNTKMTKRKAAKVYKERG